MVVSLDAVVELIAGRFGRVEPRRRVSAYLRGLVAGLDRTTPPTPSPRQPLPTPRPPTAMT